ncbi:OLC1v1015824C1 [Oldenlandia corymbosa var. corymbosa]|uniref:OLC1v1015824C1 n=1 Tax=Oldenlandia corymbosa var. corymbosa TaxID=529605 RepID=A0AAV1E520_OLDCO|nr:OLC1v1015824C1 [Oldenlandia corymbosa var. corymbosa]
MTGSRTQVLNASHIITRQEEINSDIEQKGSPKKYPSSSGGWRSASCILESNLITFLTGPLEESVAAAESQVNTWMGVVSLVPIMGALLADSFVGCYRSIIVFSTLYIMHGYKLCIQAFGADQFDGNHQLPSKRRAKSSFFNWWIYGTSSGAVLAHLTLHYIQDNISWGIGFGIPCIAMIVGLVLFLLGTAMYRFPAARVDDDDECSCETISQRFLQVSGDSHNVVHQSLNSIIGGEEDAAKMLPSFLVKIFNAISC